MGLMKLLDLVEQSNYRKVVPQGKNGGPQSLDVTSHSSWPRVGPDMYTARLHKVYQKVALLELGIEWGY